MKKINLTVLILILSFFNSQAQSEQLYGLWLVEEVYVGDEIMTPVSKWFRINPDGTYQSGNGWLQSASGNWIHDAASNSFTAHDSLDVKDNFGAFSLTFDDDKMNWQREEEGIEVTVKLTLIENLPLSPADYLEGVWKLKEISLNEESILSEFDPERNHQLFIRWDRLYVNYTPENEKYFGYWFIHAHRPELRLIPQSDMDKMEKWEVQVDEKELQLIGISKSNKGVLRQYERGSSF